MGSVAVGRVDIIIDRNNSHCLVAYEIQRLPQLHPGSNESKYRWLVNKNVTVAIHWVGKQMITSPFSKSEDPPRTGIASNHVAMLHPKR